jgi:hypothetical protein
VKIAQGPILSIQRVAFSLVVLIRPNYRVADQNKAAGRRTLARGRRCLVKAR